MSMASGGTDASSVHRIDLPCEQTGFRCPPPHDVHIKFLPNLPPLQGWTLLAHAAAGRPGALAGWLAGHAGVRDVRIEPGLAPRLLRAKVAELPELWAAASSYVRVHHLDLSTEGHASWFIQGSKKDVVAFIDDLERRRDLPLQATEVRVRKVDRESRAPITRRQFETLATAVAMGYYEIPHRLDLRALATQTGVSLGSLSELLRRAEAAVLTHYVDSSLMSWPSSDHDPPNPFKAVEALLLPGVAQEVAHQGRYGQENRPRAKAPSAVEWPFARHGAGRTSATPLKGQAGEGGHRKA